MKVDYNFKVLRPRYHLNKEIKINRGNINFGWDAYDALGKPDRVEIYYDDQKNVVKFIKTENEESFKMVMKPKPHLGTKLGKIMPNGAYVPIGEGMYKLKN